MSAVSSPLGKFTVLPQGPQYSRHLGVVCPAAPLDPKALGTLLWRRTASCSSSTVVPFIGQAAAYPAVRSGLQQGAVVPVPLSGRAPSPPRLNVPLEVLPFRSPAITVPCHSRPVNAEDRGDAVLRMVLPSPPAGVHAKVRAHLLAVLRRPEGLHGPPPALAPPKPKLPAGAAKSLSRGRDLNSQLEVGPGHVPVPTMHGPASSRRPIWYLGPPSCRLNAGVAAPDMPRGTLQSDRLGCLGWLPVHLSCTVSRISSRRPHKQMPMWK